MKNDLTPQKFEEALSASSKIQKELEDIHKKKGIPSFGEEYFYINRYGSILFRQWVGRYEDKACLSIDNVFLTPKSAQKALKKLQIRKKLSDLAKASGEKDWYSSCYKYRLAYGHYDEKWAIEQHMSFQTLGTYYFSTEEDALAAIDEIGQDDLMLLLED